MWIIFFTNCKIMKIKWIKPRLKYQLQNAKCVVFVKCSSSIISNIEAVVSSRRAKSVSCNWDWEEYSIKSAKENNDSSFRWMWLTIILSFAFYIPVVLLADVIPMIGMLMIPKTCAYVWTVLIGYKAMKKWLSHFLVVLLWHRTKIRVARTDFGTRNMLS